MTRPLLVVLAACVGGALSLSRPAAAASLDTQASCPDGATVHVTWTFTEDPVNPTGHPEWVGYDLMRRNLGNCSPAQRVNAVPFPRTPGATESFDYADTGPEPGTLFQYQVVLVDANRQPVTLEPWLCDFCVRIAWASCPDLSAPLVHGTLVDWGWALQIMPCPQGCEYGFYFDQPEAVVALRPFVGTGAAFRFYGSPTCGTVEGCVVHLSRWESTTCDAAVATSRAGWGRLRAIYR